MKITLNIPDQIHSDALRYVANLEEYLENAASNAAACAQRENPGVDLATLPALSEREAERVKAQEQAAQEANDFSAAAQALVDAVDAQHRDAAQAAIQSLNAERDSLEDVKAKIDEAVKASEASFAKEIARQRAALIAAAADPAVQAAFANAKSVK